MASSSHTGHETGRAEALSLKRAYWISGGLAVALGVLAIVFPLAASIGVELIIGAILTAAGLIELFRVFWMRRAGRILANLLVGLLLLATGILLLAFPLQGVVSLTIVVAAFFAALGTVKLVYAVQMRRSPGWPWLAVSGAVSVALGLILLFALPEAAFWALGLLVGIDLIFFGAAQIALGRQIAHRPA